MLDVDSPLAFAMSANSNHPRAKALMFQIDISVDANKRGRDANRTIPNAQKTNWTATEVKKDLVAATGRAFDGPTPHAEQPIHRSGGRPQGSAHVYFKDFAPKGMAGRRIPAARDRGPRAHAEGDGF